MHRERRPVPDWLALGLLLCAASVRFWNLGGPSFWYDEAYSWWVGTQLSFAGSLASSLSEFIPPGAYIAWRGWAALVGTSEFALRTLSALSGIVAVAAIARAAGRLTSHTRVPGSAFPSAPHTALLLAAIAPPLLWASRELRMYGLLLAFVTVGNAALLEVILGSPRRRRAWAWLWGAMALAALYTLVLAGAWLIGLGVFFLAVLALEPDGAEGTRHAARRARIRLLAPPAIAAALLYLPWLIPALRHLGGNHGYWAGRLPLGAFLARTLQGITLFRTPNSELTAQRLGAAITAFALVAPVLAIPGSGRESQRAARRAARGVSREDLRTIFLTPLLWARPRALPRHLFPALFTLSSWLPPLLLLGLAVRQLPKWNLQHTVILAPPLYLALAAVAARPLRPVGRTGRAVTWGLRLILACIAVGLAVASFHLLTHPTLANDDWRGLSAYVREQRAPGELVIIRGGFALPTWRYYAASDLRPCADAGCDESVVPLPDDPLLDVTHVLHYANTPPVLSERLQGASGAWVIGYLAEVTDPTDIVGVLLEEVGAKREVPGFHGLALHRYTFEPAPLPRSFAYPEQPPLTVRPNIELLPGLRLWGVTLPAETPADRLLPIRTWWTTANPDEHEGRVYQASLRLVDAAGNIWAQHDAPPGGGDYRPERWPASVEEDPDSTELVPILGRFDLAMLPGTPGGTYTATLILYEIGGPQSQVYTLGPLQVGRSTLPPAVPTAFIEPTKLEGDAPLYLLGIQLSSTTVTPCQALSGALFWEVTSPLRLPYLVQIRLGREQMELTPISTSGAQDLTALQPGERFQTQFRLPIRCRALDTAAPVEVGLLMPGAAPGDPSELFAAWSGPSAEIAAGRVFELPSANVSPVLDEAGTFGTLTEEGALVPVATLAGYSVAGIEGPTGPSVPAGKPFAVVLYWRAERQTDTAYTVFVHATPPDTPGPVVAQHDSWPAMAEKPTPHWVLGEIVADLHPMPALAPGTYALRAGLYGPDGERLVTAEGDAVVVAILTVR